MLDILAIDWSLIVAFDNADLSFNQFHDTVNQIIDKYMSLKKLTNKEYKRKFKSWITNGIIKSISRKNRLYNKYTKTKNEFNKHIFTEYEALRNRVNELVGISKSMYYQSYFSEHNNNIKK